MKRIAIAGAGGMARVRARALLSTGQVMICGVAARHLETARKFSAEIGCETYFDDYTQLAGTQPDAILVEVPHETQDQIVLWALEQQHHVLIGGTLSTSVQTAQQIVGLAQHHHLTVEAGFEARYSPAWEYAKSVVEGGALGRLVAVHTLALWDGQPNTWYYQQQTSGGMPLTHMTYCFINPVRWIMGDVQAVSAFANRKKHTAPGLVNEENCVANLLFQDDVLCNMTAGFVKPGGLPAWQATFIGTQGALDVRPDEGGAGVVIHYGAEVLETHDFRAGPNAFDVQARTFIAALDGRATCRNSPQLTLGDIQVAEAIVASAHQHTVVAL
jgi:myo-inositol 2-dehydrogenase/D-chiro-inositol 1-dehydrogenase